MESRYGHVFYLKQGKIRVIWNEFEEHFEGHNWTEGASPRPGIFDNLYFIFSLEGPGAVFTKHPLILRSLY